MRLFFVSCAKKTLKNANGGNFLVLYFISSGCQSKKFLTT